jgi:rubrerythrin
MTEFRNITDVLDFAIGEEQAAMDFYLHLADSAKQEEMKKVFREFAGEEMKHKAKLLEVKIHGIRAFGSEKVTEMHLSDYLVEVKLKSDLSYEEALIVAMKKEKAAFRLYSSLAARVQDQGIRDLFLSLAMEESKHKLRFEIEYDEYILREN